MRQPRSLLRVLAVLLAFIALTAAATPLQAGQSKGIAVRSGGQKAPGVARFGLGPQGLSRSGSFKARHFSKHRRHQNVVRRADKRRRPYTAPGYAYPYYPYGVGYSYRYAPPPPAPPKPVAGPAAPTYRDRPVTPKWVHVSSLDGDLGSQGFEGAPIGGTADGNCLTVKTQITVEGEAVDAFGEACLTADGDWVLRPERAVD